MTTTNIARTTLLNALVETSPRPGKELDALVKAAGCTAGQLNGACRDLKLWGLMFQPSRGMYSITEVGRTVAARATLPAAPRKVATVAEATVAEAPTMARAEETAAEAPVSETAPAAETPAVETPAVETAPAKRRLKVANAPAVPAVEVPEWLADEGIRALAIEATDCFGAWSAKSAECGKCPLAGWCRNAKASTLALLASKLATETPAAPEGVKPSVAKLDEAVGAANAPDAPRAAVPEALAGVRLKATHDGVCAVSGRPVSKGDAVRYVAGVGVVHLDVEVPAK
jgi:hypothetical protein